MAKAKTAVSETKQVGRFGLIGIINTVIDVSILNVLALLQGIPPVAANFVSTSVAMVFSFLANRSFVFKSKQRNTLKQALLFLVLTAFGLYVIQTLIVFRSLTVVWPHSMDWLYAIVQFVNLDGVFTKEFVTINGAKAFAIACSMVWNYLSYKKIVFKK